MLFYSGGWWESDELRRSATPPAPAPLGPFRKETETGPWLASRGQGWPGPGGAEVFADADGGWRIAFHAWTPPRVGYDDGGARSLWIERLEFRDGRPGAALTQILP